MASSPDNVSMALFCDFENVALGVRDANYEKFDIKPILERLLLKGSIVVKKAYCDWERYKGFKATMHEANFELIEIPHVRQSGKNSADIRLVVDALDLCYTKSHVNTFVIISGDSDFSPLVSKLRENAKQVIGVGVKQSTSDLLIANCDEFIFYDDLVREKQRALARRQPADAQPAARRTPEEERSRKESMDARRTQAVEMAVETFDALVSERGDTGKIWASVLKEAIKRRKPDFSESYYGFRTFGNLLEEAQSRGLLEFGRDEKSGAYVYRSSGLGNTPVTTSGQGNPAPGRIETPVDRPPSRYFQQEPAAAPPESALDTAERRDRGRRGRRPDATPSEIAASSQVQEAPQARVPDEHAAVPDEVNPPVSAMETPTASAARAPVPEAGAQPDDRQGRSYFRPAPPATGVEPAAEKAEPRRRARGGRKPATAQMESTAVAPAPVAPDLPPAPQAAAPAPHAAQDEATATPHAAPKAPARPRRPRKAAPKADNS